MHITLQTPLALSKPASPTPPPVKLADHTANQQIMAVFAATDAPLQARAVCEAMDLEIAPHSVNDVRLKLRRGCRCSRPRRLWQMARVPHLRERDLPGDAVADICGVHDLPGGPPARSRQALSPSPATLLATSHFVNIMNDR